MKRGPITRLRLIAVATAVGLLVMVFLFLREPTFEGKTFSQWLANYERISSLKSVRAGAPQPVPQEAIEAFRSMGEPAVRRLIDRIDAHDPPWKLQLLALARKQSFFKLTSQPANVRRQWATLILVDLGPTASNAVPRLIDWVITDKWGDAAGQVLAAIGPAAVAPLRTLLHDTNQATRIRAMTILGWIGAEATPAIPDLAGFLSGTNRAVRSAAIRTLGAVALPGSEIEQRLVQLFHDPRDTFDGAYALVSIGSNAIPVLTRGLTNQQVNVRCAAVGALRAWANGWRDTPRTPREHLRWKVGLSSTFDARALTVALRPESESSTLTLMLVKNLDDPDPQVRELSARMLAVFPPGGEQVLWGLERCAQDPVLAVRAAAQETLVELRKANAFGTSWPGLRASPKERVGTPR